MTNRSSQRQRAWRSSPLAWKVFAISVASILLTSTLSWFWFYWEGRRQQEMRAIADLELFLEQIEPSLVRSAWQINEDNMQVLLDAIQSNRGVTKITYHDASLDLHVGEPWKSTVSDNGCTQVIERDYSATIYEEQPLGSGHLNICFNAKMLGQISGIEVWRQMLPLLSGILLAALGISVAIVLIIVKPLHALSTHIAANRSIEDFRRSVFRQKHAPDELDRLIDELRQRTRELSRERRIVELSIPEVSDMIIQTDRDFRVFRSNSTFDQLVADVEKPIYLDTLFDRSLLAQVGLHENISGPHDRRYELRTVQFGDDDRGGYLFIIRDLTEQVRQQLRAVHEGKMSVLGTLSSGVAHDFNNILAAIMGNAELILDDAETPEENRIMLESIIEFAQRGASLSNQLLSFARRKAQSKKAIPADIPVRRLVEIARPLIGNSVALTMQFEAERSVYVDRALLESAIMNLVVNARDAVRNKKNAHIHITTTDVLHDGKNYVCYAVTDNGSGMSQEIIDRVREPFFTTKGRDQGSGMGLAMVSGFAEQSGGYLDFTSEQGQGTTAQLCVPVAETVMNEEWSSNVTPITAGRIRGKILIIEDEPTLRDVMGIVLERDGHTTDRASSLREVMDKNLHLNTYDLVLSDVVLEGSTAIEIIELFRANGNPSPFALVSGNLSNEFMEKMAAYGDMPTLDKPFRNQELVNFVASCLVSNRSDARMTAG